MRYVEESSAHFLNVPGVVRSQAVTELSSGSSLCSFRYTLLPLRPRFQTLPEEYTQFTDSHDRTEIHDNP